MSNLKIPVSNSDHRQGVHSNKLILVEFGDYQCPYCGEAYWMVKELQNKFHMELQFVFRNFPLSTVHPQALTAAVTAELAGSNGYFWQAHDALFENQRALGMDLYTGILSGLSIPSSELTLALEKDTYSGRINSDFNGGVRSGVNGTPSFYINGFFYDGSVDLESMTDALTTALLAAN